MVDFKKIRGKETFPRIFFSDENSDFSYRQIADTFFAKPKKDTPPKEKPGSGKKALFTAAFLFLAALALFSIIIILYTKSASMEVAAPASRDFYPEGIISGGWPNRERVEKIYFEGGGLPKSSLLDFSVKLADTAGDGSASLVIVFKKPADFSGKAVFLSAKTGEGVKKIKFILKDAENRLCESAVFTFSADWTSSASFLQKRRDFDLGNVKAVKIEFAVPEGKEAKDSAVYIKDILIGNGA